MMINQFDYIIVFGSRERTFLMNGNFLLKQVFQNRQNVFIWKTKWVFGKHFYESGIFTAEKRRF